MWSALELAAAADGRGAGDGSAHATIASAVATIGMLG